MIYTTRLEMMQDLLPHSEGAEIGVQRGVFSRQILTHCPVRKLWLVDAWRHLPEGYAADPANISDGGHEENYREVLRTVGREIWTKRVEIIRELSDLAADRIPDGSLDWVYFDANHTYDGLMVDLRAWAPKVRAGGCLMGHDFTDNEAATAMGFGVVRAVADFCAREGWRLTAVSSEEWPSFKLERAS